MTLDLDFSMQQGAFALTVSRAVPTDGVTAIFGPSGAGKSTLLRAIAGFAPTQGQIRFGDEVWEDGQRFVPPHRRRVGFVFQEPRLFTHLTVAGNLGYAARRAGQMAAVPSTINRFGLEPLLRRHPAHLSGGEAQRVALARTLLAAPRLLLMDEPLSSLDATRRDEILPYIEQLRDEARVPILYVSHALNEVVRLATQVLALTDGRVVAMGPTAAVLADAHAAPAFGGETPGSLIDAQLVAQEADGLSRLRFGGGELLVPALRFPVGAAVRLLVAPRDVMIATARPEAVSALNILPATIVSLTQVDPGVVMVTLSCGGTQLVARVTTRSVAALGLGPGTACHAILKSVALARD